MSYHAEIRAFLQRTRMPECVFGRRAMNDPRFMSDLRQGRELRPKTIAKVRAFIAEQGA